MHHELRLYLVALRNHVMQNPLVETRRSRGVRRGPTKQTMRDLLPPFESRLLAMFQRHRDVSGVLSLGMPREVVRELQLTTLRELHTNFC